MRFKWVAINATVLKEPIYKIRIDRSALRLKDCFKTVNCEPRALLVQNSVCL